MTVSAWCCPGCGLSLSTDDARALTHPLRLGIMRMLVGVDRLSPVEVHRQLEAEAESSEPAASLGTIAYHVRALVRFGMIASAGSRPRRGATEHFYSLTDQGRHLLGSEREEMPA